MAKKKKTESEIAVLSVSDAADVSEYEKTKWVDWVADDVNSGTPLDARHFNHMEEGIYEANSHVYRDSEGYLCVHFPEAVPMPEDDPE